jgi:hypothetical protein
MPKPREVTLTLDNTRTNNRFSGNRRVVEQPLSSHDSPRALQEVVITQSSTQQTAPSRRAVDYTTLQGRRAGVGPVRVGIASERVGEEVLYDEHDADAAGPSGRDWEEANSRQNYQWRQIYPELKHHMYLHRASLGSRRQRAEAQLRKDWQDRLEMALKEVVGEHCRCPYCHTGGGDFSSSPFQLRPGNSSQIRFCTLEGWVNVSFPDYRCQTEACQFGIILSPVELGCFPSTPSCPTTFYDQQLLSLTQLLTKQDGTAARSWRNVIEAYHELNGFQNSGAMLSHLRPAMLHFTRINELVTSPAELGLQPLGGDGGAPHWERCPACYRTCPYISGDATQGARRFKNAATASLGLQPIGSLTPVFPPDRMKEALECRLATAPKDLAKPECVSFKAIPDNDIGKMVKLYDHTGLVAFVCPHGFVIVMASMITTENFVYYDELLKEILPQLVGSNGQLPIVFMDMGCQYEAHFRR